MKRTNLENILKGLDLIREAVALELNEEVVETETTNVVELRDRMKVEETTEEVQNEEVVENEVEETEEEITSNLDILNGMTLKELKELAKELEVSTKGSKSAIIGRIVEAQEQQVEELDQEESVEEVVEETTEDEVEETEETVVNELEEQLQAMDVEDLADILSEAGISAKGKKQALVAKVLQAVEEGKIELATEEDVEEVASEEEVVEEVAEENGVELEDILDTLGTKDLKDIAKALDLKVTLKDKKASLIEKISGADINSVIDVLVSKGIIEANDEEVEEEATEEEELVVEGSDVRIEAVENKFAELMEAIDSEEITDKDVKEFLEEYYADNKSELKKIEAMDSEDLATKYCWIQANLIDDEGQEVDFNEPYLVGETPYCCGVPMKKINENTFVCEIDGEEVELED